MNVITRGVRNAFRNSIRTFSIVLILALSIGLALTMLIARQAVDSKINSVKRSIGNVITISPAGVRGFEGGGEPLTTAEIDKVNKIDHVNSVVQTLRARLDSDSTSLESAVEAGSLGRRNGSGSTSNNSSSQMAPPSGRQPNSNFKPPVMLTGTDSLSGSILDGGGAITVTSGEKFDPAQDQLVALIGTAVAEKNLLKTGSTFTVYGQTVTVKGIYDAGNRFSNNAVLMPLSTVQRLSGQTGEVSSAIVTVDSISNVKSTTLDIQNSLGSDVADVTSLQDSSSQALEPLEGIKSISTYSLVGSVFAGAIIILLAMMMIVRERRREIGVLKAIGASNIKVVTQFVAEAITFTLLAAIVGIGIGVAAGGAVTKILVSSSANSAAGSGGMMGGPRTFGSLAGIGGESLRSIQATVGWEVLGYGFLAALIIAVAGSSIPAYIIARVRPAEVMRAE
ncbi:ABC transporter permease [Patescibacteria group bacterium]|nr:MAG: ABC transporter permease [Patescibacteria group bacterium]